MTEETINFWVNGVCTCVAVITGIILNCVAIYIIWNQYERTKIFYRMLICLLCFDICVLVTWMNLSLFLAFKLNYDVIIHMLPYFSYPLPHIAITASTFMTVAIAHERYLAVRDPLKYSAEMKTPNLQVHRLKLYMLIVIVIAVVFNIPYFIELEVKYVNPSNSTNLTDLLLDKYNNKLLTIANKYNVTIPNITSILDHIIMSNRSNALLTPTIVHTTLGKDPYYLKYYRFWARLIVTGFVPFALLIFFNISIYNAIKKNAKRRQSLLSSQPSAQPILIQYLPIYNIGRCSIRTSKPLAASTKLKDEENLSMSFVGIVTVCLLCHSLKFVLNFYDGFSGKVGATRGSRIAAYFSNFLVVLNSSINMIIYCIMNTKFRKYFLSAMRNMCPCIKRHVERTNTQYQSPTLAARHHTPKHTALIERLI